MSAYGLLSLSEKINSLESEINEINTKNNSLQSKLDEMNDKYNNLETKYIELAKFKNKNTCFECGTAVGITPGSRKVCKECKEIFCYGYNKGGFNYDEKSVKYLCKKCFSKYKSNVLVIPCVASSSGYNASKGL